MIVTSLDVLYIAIAIAIILLTIFVCVNLVFTVLILRDISKATEKVRDTAEKVNEFVVGPIRTIQHLADYLKKIADTLAERYLSKDKNSD